MIRSSGKATLALVVVLGLVLSPVLAAEDIWAIGEGNQVARVVPTFDARKTPTWMRSCASSSQGSTVRVWSTDNGDNTYYRESETGGWRFIAGKLKLVKVMPSGRIWGIGQANDVFTRDGPDGTWQSITGKSLAYLDVNSNGEVWGIESGNANGGGVTYRNGPNGEWQWADGILKYLRVKDSGEVWGVTSGDGRVFYKNGFNGAWQVQSGSGFVYLDVNNVRGDVWAIKNDDSVYYRNSPTGDWRSIDGKVNTLRVYENGVVVGINSEGHLLRRETVEGNWEKIGEGFSMLCGSKPKGASSVLVRKQKKSLKKKHNKAIAH